MTFRERCALAAMREILRVDLPEGRIDAPDDVAASAKDYADAMVSAMGEPMEAERAKRIHAAGHATEVEKARREGRDAGLRDVRSVVLAVAGQFNSAAPRTPLVLELLQRLDVMIAAVPVSFAPAPAPDVASLQAEHEFVCDIHALLAATRAEALRLAMAECEAEAALNDSEKSGLDAGSAARNCRDRIEFTLVKP